MEKNNRVLVRKTMIDNYGNTTFMLRNGDKPNKYIIICDRNDDGKVIHYKNERTGVEYWKDRNNKGKVIHYKQITKKNNSEDIFEWWKDKTVENDIKTTKYRDTEGLEYTKIKYPNNTIIKEYNNGNIKKYVIKQGKKILIYYKKGNDIELERIYNEKGLMIKELTNKGKKIKIFEYDDKDRIVKIYKNGELDVEFIYSDNDNSFIRKFSNGEITEFNRNLRKTYCKKIINGRVIEEYFVHDSSDSFIMTYEMRENGKLITMRKYNDMQNMIYELNGNIEKFTTYNTNNDSIIKIEEYKIIEDK